jgi:Uma2 family endonuclease
MSVIDIPSQPTREEPVAVRWTRRDYYRMADIGLIRDRHVQLIEGEVVEMAPQGHAHAKAVTLIDYALRPIFAAGYTIRIQLPLHLGDYSEPEPDIAVIAGSPRDQRDDHPSTALLVIEVSDTTLAFDRQTKSRVYAAAGIPEYWVLNLVDRRLEIFRTPFQAPHAQFTQLTTLHPGDKISPLAAPHATIAVADLLP